MLFRKNRKYPLMIGATIAVCLLVGCTNTTQSSVSEAEYKALVDENTELKSKVSELETKLETQTNDSDKNIESIQTNDNEKEAENTQTTDYSSTGAVLIDSDDIYIECRGIYDYSDESKIVNLYVKNNRDSKFILSLKNLLVNGCSVSIGNSVAEISANSTYISSAKFSFVVNTKDLEPYSITSIDTLTFDLEATTGFGGDTITKTTANVDLTKIS